MAELEPEESVLDIQFRDAALGDVLQDDAGRPIPDGWHLMDGSVLIAYEWPAFVAQMGIKGGTFTLPAPQRVAEGRHWLIKLGEKRAIPRPEGPRPAPAWMRHG